MTTERTIDENGILIETVTEERTNKFTLENINKMIGLINKELDIWKERKALFDSR